MGFEQIAIAFYEMPDLLREMIDYMCDFNLAILEKLVCDIDFDYANGWEDIAFRNGPIIGPAMFREFLLPGYRRIASFLRRHGINVIFTDCDGDINPIVDLWVEAGFTCQFPLEVAAGTDPVALRERFGDRVLLIGGVNKRALIAGRDAIDREMERLAPLVAHGGFIPHVDHRCPPDVTFENYLHYLEAKKKILGF
jgi:uroporphyrinogen-III decarboxylase